MIPLATNQLTPPASDVRRICDNYAAFALQDSPCSAILSAEELSQKWTIRRPGVT
jgi:hypothetical protein